MTNKYARLIEIAEELGKVPVSSISDLATTIADLKELGYTAYLDASTDYLIIEKH
jgi:H2-forming N5,N10-methylenetetrahydromethanopterin dehydrogenase-like enzyme